MTGYLGQETVPFDPNAGQFDPVPAGMYYSVIDGVNDRFVDTKYGKARVLNVQHRILLGDQKGRSVWGSVFVYTAGDNPDIDFSSNLWVNNGYFNFIRNINAVPNDDLVNMIEAKTMPLLSEDQITGKYCWVMVEHRTYWKKEIPNDERTDENQSTQAFVKNWIATDIGCQVMHVEESTIATAREEADALPF